MKLYKAYLFRDKDPAIDELRTIVQDHFGKRNLGHKEFAQMEKQGGPAATTMDSWFNRETRRPQNATLEAAGRAIGYVRVWQRRKAALRIVKG